MKIGILTFHETLNYGAVLQAFALEKYIQMLGYDAECINYRCNAVYAREFPQSLKEAKSLKNKVKYIFGEKNFKSKEQSFKNFQMKWMDISSIQYDRSNIEDSEKKYACFIAGSDQIWNLILTDGDTTYFLDFVTDLKKKNVYAASFGYASVPEKYVASTTKVLNKKFNNISVREVQGAEIIKEITKNDVDVVLDPTLLLKANQWREILNLRSEKKDRYIFVYLPHDKKSVFTFAKQLAKKTGCIIYYANITYIPYPGVKNFFDLSPREFLSMIDKAEYIITGSFHGTAFSINFGKQFFYEDSIASGKNGSRVANLVKMLGLKNRRIPQFFTIDSKIDYTEVHKKLDIQRVISYKYIQKCLNDSL